MADNTGLVVWVESDQARLALAIHHAGCFRFWLAAHELSRLAGGPGWCAIDSLFELIAHQPGLHITRRHFRRVLSAGDGLFWDLIDSRLRLVSISKLSAELCLNVGLHNLPEVTADLPGRYNRIQISLAGSHEQFESELYRAWLLANPRNTFSRATLCALFNRGDDTLRRWESRQAGHITVIPNFALVESGEIVADDQHYNRALHGQVYQIVNSYQAHGLQTARTGQKRKIKQAVRGVVNVADAQHTRLYYLRFKSLHRSIRRHPGRTTRYLFVGLVSRVGLWKRSPDIFTTL